MKRTIAIAVAVFVLATAGVSTAQTRLVGPPKGDIGVGPMSLFDVTGEENLPSALTSLGSCTSSPCSFQGMLEDHWARNIRYGTSNCKTDFKNSFFTVFTSTFNPVPGAQYLEIDFRSQVAISNHNSSSSLVGLAFSCTVSQAGFGSIPCPGTTAQPFLTRQNTDTGGNRTGNLGFSAYNGMVQLANDTSPVTVTIQVKTSDGTNAATGAMCYTFVELTQYYSPPSP